VTRPWRRLDAPALSKVPVNTGVFAVREVEDGDVRAYMAGATARFGLRGELEAVLHVRYEEELEFTYVSTNNYFTLYRERRAFPDRFDAVHPFLRRDGHTVAQRGPA
jgi:hypothetical protein